VENFTPVAGLIGGALIGAAAALLLVSHGRIAGISGILGGVLMPTAGDTAWRVSFIAGLWIGGLAYTLAAGEMFPVELNASWPMVAIAGVLVGFGTRIGSGCTSGHGVCGIARMSRRSLVATGTFMAAAMLTVFVARHVA
jgi:uncharacterized membrane protein YedE/YeeE